MASTSTFGSGTITDAARYWLEVIPYTAVLTNVAAGATVSVFSVRNWNPAGDPAGTYVELEAVGASPVPNVQLVVTADQTQERYDLATWPTDLTPKPIRAGAFRQISLAVNNKGASPVPAIYLTYRMIVWKDPVAMKLLRGGPTDLTAADQQTLQALGLSASQFAARGHTPLPVDAIIRSSTANRLVDVAVPYALMTTIQAGQQTTLPTFLTGPNQMLVLREIAVGAAPEDGVTITVDRDSNLGHVVVQALPGDVDHPLTAFVPALQSLTVHLSADAAPSGPIPVQLTIWRVALSELWWTRLNLVTPDQLQQQIGQAAAQQVVSRVQAGVL